jgi:hypothetical protein
MPEKPTEVGYTSNKMYEVKVMIKELDYTNDLIEIVLSSSLSTAYQVIDVTLMLDPNDIIIQDIFGGEPIKLSITLMREQDYPGPRIDIELMYLTSNLALTEKGQQSEPFQKDRTQFKITTVARNPFKTMSSVVNDVFIGTNLSSVASSLASDVGATLVYDTNGQNKVSIDQVCIPPTTFYKIIKEANRASDDIFDGYLDQRFGLFSGTPGVFCQYDNKVYIKNLTAKLGQNQTFTVYQLAGGISSKFAEKIYDESLSGNVFYTYDMIYSDYAGNARFAQLASTINNLVRPKDSLTATISQDLETVAKDYSLLYSQRNKNLFIDASAKRTKYYNEDTGNDKDPTLFNSRFGRSLSNMSTLSLNLERNLPLLNLIDVGECVKFKPYTIEYQDFEGKYILWSSVIKLTKRGPDWQTTAQINLSRTNKKN